MKELQLEDLNKIITKAHNYLYANEGLSNSESLEELLKLMYTKIRIENFYNEYEVYGMTNEEILKITKETYKELMVSYPEIYIHELKIKDETIIYVMKLFEEVSFNNLKSDKKGHIFQRVLDRSYRERNGQFFTPNAVVDFIVEMISPKSHELGSDPACGTGGFLFSALGYIYKHEKLSVVNQMYFSEISEQIGRLIKMRTLFEFGIEDPNLTIGDSLEDKVEEKFDYVLSNPPFGSAGRVTNKEILTNYELGHNHKTGKVMQNQVPDILFVEKIIKSLKYGGRGAIVLPNGNLENPSSMYLREYLLKNVKMDAVVLLPSGTFIPYGTGVETSIIFFTRMKKENLESLSDNDYYIFFSKINKLGYSFSKHSKEERLKDGSIDQDYKEVVDAYKNKKYDDKSFLVKYSNLSKTKTFSYSYYSPIYNSCIMDIKKKKYALLKEVVNIKKEKVKIDPEKEYEYVEIADISARSSEIMNSTTLLGSDLPTRASYLLNTGDVVVAIAGNAIGTEKNAKALVTDEHNNSICTNGFAVLKTKNISPYYLIHFLNSDNFLNQVRKHRYGSAIPTLAKEDLLNFVIPLYDDKLMTQIESDIKKAYEYKMYARELMKKRYL